MDKLSYTMNRLVKLQRLSGNRDERNQPIPNDWVDVAQVWADIRHQNGLEAIKADAHTSIVKASIRIRYRADLDASMRVVYGESIYKIKAVLPDLVGKRYVDLACEVING